MNLSGPMVNENIQCFIDCANELLRADETMRALWLLDNMPAWRRDNPHPEITKLKNEVMKNIATASFYATDAGSELKTDPNVHRIMKHTLRGDMILKETKFLNTKLHKPTVFDLGPGEAFCPKLLIEEKVKFTYYPIFVNHPSFQHYYKDFESALGFPNTNHPNIFFACEVLEHLHKEDELRYEMNRHCGMADVIYISTPLHTFDTNCLDWKTKGALGHLRAYCPSEFILTVQRMFPEYNLNYFESQPQQIRGVWKDTKFDVVKAPIGEIFK